MNFTRGVWKKDLDHIVSRELDNTNCEILLNDHNSVAKLFGPDKEANGHLIKTSPEMYTALEVAEQALCHIVPSDCWSTGPLTGNKIADHIICPGCVALSKIRATLAKARGEQ